MVDIIQLSDAATTTPKRKGNEMLPEILRYNINEFGRWTLVKASEMQEEGVSLNAICGDLGLSDDVVENCIQAGTILRRIAAEQKRFENAIVEPA